MEISYFAIIIGAIFVNNVVLAQFLGICPFLGVSSKVETSLGMGAAVTFVMALTAVVAWPIQTYILVPLHIEYMQTIVFILVIAALVQMVEIMLKKLSPSLYQALGIFLPLITTNCAVLGVAILMIQKEFNLLQSVTYSVSTALGFALALVLFAGIRERLEFEEVPKAFRGVPIALITPASWPWPSWDSRAWYNPGGVSPAKTAPSRSGLRLFRSTFFGVCATFFRCNSSFLAPRMLILHYYTIINLPNTNGEGHQTS